MVSSHQLCILAILINYTLFFRIFMSETLKGRCRELRMFIDMEIHDVTVIKYKKIPSCKHKFNVGYTCTIKVNCSLENP